APEGAIVVADRQTAGRGRFQRPWVSPPGAAIYLSLVLRPAPEHLLQLGMVASLAVVRAVARSSGLAAAIKWPNDIEAGGRKLAGILIDSAMGTTGVDHAVVGIGLNISLDPTQFPEIAETATSLSRELGRIVDRREVLQALLVEIEEVYERVKHGQSIVKEWRQRLSTLGHRVTVAWPGDREHKSLVEHGTAEDVDEDGALILRRQDGSRVKLIAGEVTLRG
ncbi:MAG: biotin--[acetyl-CoA-carboxylase] ligase, partial [Dehalococcoidia bacterium]